ncbi:MAG: serine hydrolase [Gemmatimonadales bacterium]
MSIDLRAHLRWATALGLVVSHSASAQSVLPSGDSLTRLLRPWMEQGLTMGVTVGIANQSAARVKSMGHANELGSAPPTDSTIFEIGSISKVLTGTLLADMVIRGEVGLDDPVRRYLPPTVHVPSRANREITLRDLATHASGLPRDPDNQHPADARDPMAGYGEAELYAFLSSYTLTRAPGDSVSYSNVGMALLGHALARRAGRDYESLVRERILMPLGMRDTYIGPASRSTLAGREAAGHTEDLDPTPAWTFRGSVLLGEGAWRSSARDMLKFARAAASPLSSVVGRALYLAEAPQREFAGPGDSVGLGWMALDRHGRRLLWHNGGTGGFTSMLAVERATGRGVIVLTNAFADIDLIAYHLLDPAVPFTPPSPRPWVTVAPSVADRYVGTYEFPSGSRSQVVRDGDRLYYIPSGVPRMRLYAENQVKFFLRSGRDVEFVVDNTGAVREAVIRRGSKEFRARRVDR